MDLSSLSSYRTVGVTPSDPRKSLPQWGLHFLSYTHRLNQIKKRSSGVYASLSERERGEYYSQRPPTPLLDTVNYPIHMKNLSTNELKQLADELRSDVIFSVSRTGGHLGSSLGVVELTVALHYVFNAPQDKILWDVGHQSYPHKILTGRRDKMHTMRQTNGLSGFTKRSESEFDCFGTGHSSTTISAGLGMAVGRDLKGRKNNVVAVIGDGAMTAGQAYEAMNNAGYLDSDMIVILNDNKQVSLPTATLDGPIPPVGALSSALSRLQSNRPLRELREVAKGVTKRIGGPMHELAAKVDEYARGMISGSGSSLFEELGLYYIGPVDGHNINDLVAILNEVKSTNTTGPVLIHVITEKGRGYPYAEKAADKYHGVTKFDPPTGKQFKSKATTRSYTTYFAEALIAEAEADKDVVAIHAAMGGGTGMNLFHRRFPTRCFDVGIAEQHAVTFAAGLACEGLKPFCAIYSSFMQRAYDQVVHDVDLQKLPVRFAMDRAGLVGADGPTHCGSFDVTFMACLPNMVVMAPSDEAELFHMVATAAAINDRPSCFRYPRGNGIGVQLPTGNKGTPLEIGARIIGLHHFLMLFMMLAFSVLFDSVKAPGLGLGARYMFTMAVGRLLRAITFASTILPSARPWCAGSRFRVPGYPHRWAQKYYVPYATDHDAISRVIKLDTAYVDIGKPVGDYQPDWGSMSFLIDFLRPTVSEGPSWYSLLKKAGGGCNDLLYSGHMLVAVLTAMAWTEAYGGFSSALVWLLVMHSAQREIRERHHYTVDCVVAIYVGILLWKMTGFIWSHEATSSNRRLTKFEKIQSRLIQASKDSDIDEVRELLKEIELSNEESKNQTGIKYSRLFRSATIVFALVIVVLAFTLTSDG